MKYFFTALMFYTRIPCPKWVNHEADALNKATVFFPMIGWLVGIIAAGTYAASSFIFGPSVSILLSIIASVLTTGAFHEDGFADVCDAFGGGWTKAKILEIMKDSRIGAYGMIGMALLLLLKFSSLVEIASLNSLMFMVLISITAHSFSRFCAVVIIYFYEYVRENEDSKAKPIAKKLSFTRFCATAVIGIAPLVFLPLLVANDPFGSIAIVLLPILMCLISVFFLSRFFYKWIGGYTGDCLGATQQVTEVVFYLTILAVCTFI